MRPETLDSLGERTGVPIVSHLYWAHYRLVCEAKQGAEFQSAVEMQRTAKVAPALVRSTTTHKQLKVG